MGKTGNLKPEHNGMKPGDIITSYKSGFFKLVNIHERKYQSVRDIPSQYIATGAKIGDEYSPLMEFIQVADKNGAPKKGKMLMACDAFYCMPAARAIDKQIAGLEKQKASLEAFKNTLASL